MTLSLPRVTFLTEVNKRMKSNVDDIWKIIVHTCIYIWRSLPRACTCNLSSYLNQSGMLIKKNAYKNAQFTLKLSILSKDNFLTITAYNYLYFILNFTLCQLNYVG